MSNYPSRRSDLDYQRSRREDDPDPTGVVADGKSPRRTAVVTFLAFVVGLVAGLMSGGIVSGYGNQVAGVRERALKRYVHCFAIRERRTNTAKAQIRTPDSPVHFRCCIAAAS
jgi:hypothetical protein